MACAVRPHRDLNVHCLGCSNNTDVRFRKLWEMAMVHVAIHVYVCFGVMFGNVKGTRCCLFVVSLRHVIRRMCKRDVTSCVGISPWSRRRCSISSVRSR